MIAGSLFTTLASLPSTTNYELNSYGFGSGGAANSTTSNYALEGITGELSGTSPATTSYTTNPGFIQTQQANVPKVTLTNPSNYYDKLHFTIDQQGNPTDALYALRIQTTSTTCSSPTGTYYVQSDDTIGASLALADYQDYATWGGSGGASIIGLTASTTYCLSAKATQGKFTESAYGPASSAATVGQSITFCLYTSDGNCSSSSHATSFSGLLAGTVSTASNTIDVNFSTNADSGGNIYIYSTGALTSTSHPGTSINSAPAGTADDLSSLTKGYGAVVTTPVSMIVQPPYLASGNLAGSLATTIQTMLSASAPVNSVGNVIQLKAKVDNLTNAASDYADTITVIAAASF
ncbi:MAG: hypothetical protein ACREGG_01690 [Candidatus Saccharimonadales bacterium]